MYHVVFLAWPSHCFHKTQVVLLIASQLHMMVQNCAFSDSAGSEFLLKWTFLHPKDNTSPTFIHQSLAGIRINTEEEHLNFPFADNKADLDLTWEQPFVEEKKAFAVYKRPCLSSFRSCCWQTRRLRAAYWSARTRVPPIRSTGWISTSWVCSFTPNRKTGFWRTATTRR